MAAYEDHPCYIGAESLLQRSDRVSPQRAFDGDDEYVTTALVNVIEVPARAGCCAGIASDPLNEVGGVELFDPVRVAWLNTANQVIRTTEDICCLVRISVRKSKNVTSELALIFGGTQVVPRLPFDEVLLWLPRLC